MKSTGTGRIIVWRGGSLWIGLAGAPTDFHSHHAVQISLSLSTGKIQFRCPGENWNDFDAAIVAANQPHAFGATGVFVANILVEPESRVGRLIHKRCLAKGVVAISNALLTSEIAALAECYQTHAPNQKLIACADAVIVKLTGLFSCPVNVLDSRIEQAVERLRERIGETILLADIANAVHLSPERFRHLFVEETGMRFRPYVLWLRVEMALAAFTAGKSMTEAAHCGGFADSAHFSRTFKRMFGLAPSSIELQ